MAVDVGSAVGYLDLDISGFLSGLKSAQSEADSTSKDIASKIGSNLSGAGKRMTSFGNTLTKNVTAPLLGIGIAGLKTATDFEKAMSGVQAITGARGKDFDDLRDTAIDLGASTKFSANEVAEAMTEMAKAGWNSQDIIAGMGGVLDATAASGENLGTVATIVADAITGFGLEAKDSARVADLLTQAANSGTIGINDLGESFKYIAPVAGSLGMDIDEVTAAISAMSDSGIKGSQAGTSLRTLLANLVNPTEAMMLAMVDLGLAVEDSNGSITLLTTNADGSFKSLDEILRIARASMSGMTEEQRAQTAAVLAGKTGMSGFLALMGKSQEEYDEITESMRSSKGVAQETATVMQDNLQSKIEQLGGALESLAIRLADHVVPGLQKVVEWVTTLVDKFTALDPETQKTILKFAGLAIAAGPVISILGKITTGAGTLFTAFGKLSGGFKAVAMGGQAGTGILAKLGGAFAGITAPIAAVIAVIGVLTAAFVSLWNSNEEFRTKITEIWNGIKETFNTFTQGIVDRLNSLGFEFENITAVIKAVWDGFCNLLAPVFEGVFQYISDTFTTITDAILATIDVFIALFNGDWEGVWNGAKAFFEAIWNGLKSWFENILTTITSVFDVICGWFGTTWENTWKSIGTFFFGIWNAIKTFLEEKIAQIMLFLANTLSSISTFFTNIWNGIKTTVSNTIDGIKTAVSEKFDSIKTTTETVWNNIKSAISTPIEAVKTTVSGIVDDIKTKFSEGFEAAKTTATTVFTSIKDTISNILTSAGNVVSGAIETIKGFFNFEWSLPKLKMPHFSVSWSNDGWLGSVAEFLGLPGIPSLSVSWYKKAMANGMILNGATIFGMDKDGNLMGGGEAGSETVVGTNSLLSMIRKAVYEAVGPLVTASRELAMASAELGYVTYNGFAKLKEYKTQQDKENRNGNGGDTFIFHSPKAIDEIEAAKQMKKAKRDLAEGF